MRVLFENSNCINKPYLYYTLLINLSQDRLGVHSKFEFYGSTPQINLREEQIQCFKNYYQHHIHWVNLLYTQT